MRPYLEHDENFMNKKIMIEDDSISCSHCKESIKPGESAYLCELGHFVTCKKCNLSKDYCCPSRFQSNEHIDFRGIITKKV